MAKANLVFSNGTRVNIEGTPEEVALLLERFSREGTQTLPKRKTMRKSKTKKSDTTSQKVKRKGPQQLIAELAQEGYFKAKRSITDIQKKLEEKGHIYTQSSLSPPLLRLTRNRVLRRIKEKKGWVYVV